MNADRQVVRDFGREWARFDQESVPEAELRRLFEAYFEIFPWTNLKAGAAGFDLGCGSGRWARFVAQRVEHLHCIDPSPDALAVARQTLARQSNCTFHLGDSTDLPFNDASMDFGYSLGVLHHVPDPGAALRACAAKLKPGAPLLLYMYYALENRPRWYAALWRVADAGRRLIARLPSRAKFVASDVIAGVVYWPLARSARLVEAVGGSPESMPLAGYRRASFYTMRTDALDRFGTRLEQRFTAADIRRMMEDAGLRDIQFSDSPPYWCAVGLRSESMSLGPGVDKLPPASQPT